MLFLKHSLSLSHSHALSQALSHVIQPFSEIETHFLVSFILLFTPGSGRRLRDVVGGSKLFFNHRHLYLESFAILPILHGRSDTWVPSKYVLTEKILMWEGSNKKRFKL